MAMFWLTLLFNPPTPPVLLSSFGASEFPRPHRSAASRLFQGLGTRPHRSAASRLFQGLGKVDP